MDKHLSIFEDIYDIKDNITDGQFLTLNNKLQKLIQENKDLRESLANHALIVEQPQCNCSTRYVFPGIFNLVDNNLSEYFCAQSYERLIRCENFKRLMERFPHLENIFRRIDLPFVEEPIYQEYVKDEVIMVSEILLFLVKKMSERTQFLYVSHNKITMEMAQQLVGVTMQESGVSRVVEVDMEAAMQMNHELFA
mgnify:CR=1 FL=1